MPAATDTQEPRHRRLSRRPRWWLRLPRWLRRSVAAVVVMTIVLIAAAGGYVASVDLPPDPAPPQASVLFYKDGRTVLARVGLTDRTDVSLDKVPEPVRQAFLAAEDRDFYHHFGVSLRGVARALWDDLLHGGGQGASTITQQYVRNAYLTQERSVSRKTKEAALALKVEQRWTKDEILERYLNTIYFGRGAYGIEAAAHAYFGTVVDRLTVAQGAVLAAMVKDPTQGDPAVNPTWAKDRWKWILGAMSDAGWLPAGAADQTAYPAVAPASVTARAVSGPDGLIVDRVEDELERDGISQQMLRTGGLRVTTTVDATAQRAATSSIGAALKGQPKQLRTALVAVDPDDGGVRAYYGGDRGRGYYDDALAARPPASTFKPVVLAAAEQRGISYRSLFNGTSPRTFAGRGGTPLYNDDNLQCPMCELGTAMVYSLNTPYYALTEQIGADAVSDLAHRLGVPDKYGDHRTLVDQKGEPTPGRTRADIALGRYPVTPADMASVYATLANGGVRRERHFVESVVAPTDAVLYRFAGPRTQVVSDTTAANVGAVLGKVVDHDGAVAGHRAAAKTGSQQWGNTTDSSDAWTAGWASGLTAVVWVGRNDPGPIRDRGGKAINGNGMPYAIWKSFLAAALRGQPSRDLAAPSEAGRLEMVDLKTLPGDVKPLPNLVYLGPQKGDQVDKSLGSGSWQRRSGNLTKALDAYAATVPDFSVAVTDRKTGRAYDYHGDRQFQAASVIKVELLAALLLKAQDAGRKLTGAENSRVTKMIRASDNDAAEQVYKNIGGADGLRDADDRLGLHDTDPDRSFGLTRTTANDQIRMLNAITSAGSPLNVSSKNLMLQLMSSVNADQNWGVSATAFDGEQSTLKNGWLALPAEDNHWIINSTGRISGEKTDVLVSVLSHGHAGQKDGIAVVEHVAALTRSYLGWGGDAPKPANVPSGAPAWRDKGCLPTGDCRPDRH